MHNDFTNDDLTAIRDAVPHLDLVSIRALRRAGYDIIRRESAAETARTLWSLIPRPMATQSLVSEHFAE